MRPRHLPALPCLWLFTDERQGDALWTALARLPRGAGVVFRHYHTPPAERRALWNKVRRIARARRLTLLLAGSPSQARGWRADGAHGRRPGSVTAPAHSARELIAAARAGTALAFVSPVQPTRSHPGTPALGIVRLGLMTRAAPLPVAALGGMDARRAAALAPLGITRWAAIDAWSGRGARHGCRILPRPA